MPGPFWLRVASDAKREAQAIKTQEVDAANLFHVLCPFSSGPIAVFSSCTFRLNCLVNFKTIFEQVAHNEAPKRVLAAGGQVRGGQCDGTGQCENPASGPLNAFGGHDSFWHLAHCIFAS